VTDDSLSRMTVPGVTFDIVVATLGRGDELAGLLRSLEHQTHTAFRLLIVDQNDDDRVGDALARHPGLDTVVLRSSPGLSRARNVALAHVEADAVAFPDDDCIYPDGLLEAVATELSARPDLDGVSGRAADPGGRPSGRWPATRCSLELDTLWNRANSHTIFLRRELLERVGGFDETLGLGAGTPWHSGEEIELLVRALRQGARIEYEPSLVVLHPARRLSSEGLRSIGRRDGASVGLILARHGYPARVVARMLTRPLGGAVLSVLKGDRSRARFHLATLRGRIAGLRAGRRGSVTGS
jgi:glycosyltransferase involved in cell wall biosynthesis